MASIQKRNGKWLVRVRKTGFPLHSKTFLNLKAAQTWAKATEVKLEQGIAQLPDKTIKLADILKRYKETVTPHKKSKRDETRRIEWLLRDSISLCRLVDLTPVVVTAFKQRRLPAGLRTTHYDMTVMRHAIEVARHQWGYFIPSNPFDAVKKPKLKKGRQRRLSEKEYEALKIASEKSHATYLWPLIEFALETAMRQSEITSLQWDDVDIGKRVAVVRESKNGNSRSVPLSERAMAVLFQIPAERSLAFGTTSSAVRQSWKKLTKRAGVYDLRFHDLRHEAISRFFELGLTIPEIMCVSGHKTICQVIHYAHASDKFHAKIL